jgi:hypothetical protein
MGESWANEPVEIIPGVPKDVEGLREALINMVANGQSNAASRYGTSGTMTDASGRTLPTFTPGLLNAGTNPLQTQGASMLMNMMGKGNYIPSSGNQAYMGNWGSTTLSQSPGGDGRGGGGWTNPGDRRRFQPRPDPDPGPGGGGGGGDGSIGGGGNGGGGGGRRVMSVAPPATSQPPVDFVMQMAMLNDLRKKQNFGV